MKLGFVTAILDFMNFEEVIETTSSLGYKCVELACWPQKGRSKIRGFPTDVAELDDSKTQYIKEYCQSKGVEISSRPITPTPWMKTCSGGSI